MLEHCITSRIQLDFNFNKREWNWFEHDKYHRCGEGWSRGTRRRKKDRRQNTILSRNLYLQLLISPQSLQFFPQGLSQQEASQAFAFFHCRPAKRLKQDGKDVHCIDFNCHKKNNKLRDDLNAVDKNNAFLTNDSFLQVFIKLSFDNEIFGK